VVKKIKNHLTSDVCRKIFTTESTEHTEKKLNKTAFHLNFMSSCGGSCVFLSSHLIWHKIFKKRREEE